jgi:hypothetical protein
MQTTKVLVSLQEVVKYIILTTLLRTYVGTCVTTTQPPTDSLSLLTSVAHSIELPDSTPFRLRKYPFTTEICPVEHYQKKGSTTRKTNRPTLRDSESSSLKTPLAYGHAQFMCVSS